MFEQEYTGTKDKTVTQDQTFFSQYTVNDGVIWDLGPVIYVTSA